MRSRSYLKESVIVGGFILGGALVLIGIRLMMPGRRRWSYGRPFDFERYEQIYGVGQTLVVVGAAVCVATLLAGFFFAFASPKFLAKTFQGVTIEDRIATLSDGTDAVDDAAIDDPSVKCYLRMRTFDGDLLEARCSREIFCSVVEGVVGTATVSNQRLLSFVRSGLRQTNI